MLGFPLTGFAISLGFCCFFLPRTVQRFQLVLHDCDLLAGEIGIKACRVLIQENLPRPLGANPFDQA